MTDPEATPDHLNSSEGSPSILRKKPWKVRFAGRFFLLLSIPLTCLYLRDVPRAFNYMEIGDMPPKPSILWLEYFIRDFYLPGAFARKLIRAVLPASTVASSGLLFLFGCAATSAGHRVRVSRTEAFIWSSLGAFFLGINVMTTWILWKAFVFL